MLLADEGQVVAVKPGEGGGIGGWDIRAARHALAAALRRRPEAYHETLRAHDAKVASAAAGAGPADGDGGDKPTSIHDIVMVKEEGLAARLLYDDHERRSGLVRFLPGRHDARGVRAAPRRRELGDLRDGDFAIDHLGPGQVSLVPRGHGRRPARHGEQVDPPRSAAGWRLSCSSSSRSTTAAPNRSRPRVGSSCRPAAGRRRQPARPGTTWTAPRSAHDGSGQASDVAAIGYGNDWVGVAVRAVP